MRTNRAIHVALAIVVAMWGLVFVGIAKLLPHIDPVQLVVIRFTLIALVFVGIFVVVPDTRPRLPTWKDRGMLVVLGVLAVPGSQLTIVNGQRYLSPPLVSLVVTSAPAFTAIIAAMWLRERLVARQVLGFFVALAGVVTVILAGTIGTGAFEVSNLWGAMLTVVSPMCWASFTIMSKTLTTRFAPITAVGMAMITGSLSMVPLFPHAARGLDDISAGGWGWMIYLVLGGTVIPYLVWWRALHRLTAASTTAYMYAIPFAALIWSWIILDIVPSLIALLGGIVVIIGVTLIQLGRRSATPPAAADVTA